MEKIYPEKPLPGYTNEKKNLLYCLQKNSMADFSFCRMTERSRYAYTYFIIGRGATARAKGGRPL